MYVRPHKLHSVYYYRAKIKVVWPLKLHMCSLNGGVNLLDQSQGIVMQNQCKTDSSCQAIENFSNYIKCKYISWLSLACFNFHFFV